MTIKEKLDCILYSGYSEYQLSKNVGYFDISELMLRHNEQLAHDEQIQLCSYLEKLGLIKSIGSKQGVAIELTSEGISFCEDKRSFKDQLAQNHGIIFNNIYNSSNSNIISHSNNIGISNQTTDLKHVSELLKSIKKEIKNGNDIAQSNKDDLIELVELIVTHIEGKQEAPKGAIRSLVTLLSEFSSIAGYVTPLLAAIA